MSLDLIRREVRVDGKLVELSAREFVLAETFLRHPGQVLSREQLLSHVWGYEFDPGSNVVDVYVGYLRKKLGADKITTVRGMGYRYSSSGTGAQVLLILKPGQPGSCGSAASSRRATSSASSTGVGRWARVRVEAGEDRLGDGSWYRSRAARTAA